MGHRGACGWEVAALINTEVAVIPVGANRRFGFCSSSRGAIKREKGQRTLAFPPVASEAADSNFAHSAPSKLAPMICSIRRVVSSDLLTHIKKQPFLKCRRPRKRHCQVFNKNPSLRRCLSVRFHRLFPIRTNVNVVCRFSPILRPSHQSLGMPRTRSHYDLPIVQARVGSKYSTFANLANSARELLRLREALREYSQDSDSQSSHQFGFVPKLAGGEWQSAGRSVGVNNRLRRRLFRSAPIDLLRFRGGTLGVPETRD